MAVVLYEVNIYHACNELIWLFHKKMFSMSAEMAKAFNPEKSMIIAEMNRNRPPFLDLFDCVITDVDVENGRCEMDYFVGKQYCHSGDIVQGGFVTALLDAVSSHAVMCMDPEIVGVSTLELKVSYLAASRSGKFHCTGQVERLTRNFVFLSAELFNEDKIRTATLSATAKVVRRKS